MTSCALVIQNNRLTLIRNKYHALHSNFIVVVCTKFTLKYLFLPQEKKVLMNEQKFGWPNNFFCCCCLNMGQWKFRLN